MEPHFPPQEATPTNRPPVLRTPFFYGWLIVAVVVLSNFTQVGLFNPVLSVFMKPMANEFGWTRTEVSLGITIGSIGAAFVSPVLGPYLDRYGTRLAMGLGQACYGGCVMLLGLIGNLWQFYLVFSGSRIFAIGVTNFAGNVLIANWFIRKRGRAMALAIMGIRLGQAFLPVLAQVLILGFGWRWAWVGIGMMVWVVAVVPSFLFVRRRPEDLGLLPDGDAAPAAGGLSAGGSAQQQPAQEYPWTLAQARKTPALWLLTTAWACFGLGIGSINLHYVAYFTDAGITPEHAVGSLTTLALSGIAGGMLWGVLTERWSMREALTLAFIAEGLTTLWLLTTPTTLSAYIFGAIYGFNFGGLQTLTSVMLPDYFGRQSAGAINGFAAPPQMLGNALGPVLSGAIYDLTGSYSLAFAIIAATYLLGGAVMVFAKRPAAPAPVVPMRRGD